MHNSNQTQITKKSKNVNVNATDISLICFGALLATISIAGAATADDKGLKIFSGFVASISAMLILVCSINMYCTGKDSESDDSASPLIDDIKTTKSNYDQPSTHGLFGDKPNAVNAGQADLYDTQEMSLV